MKNLNRPIVSFDCEGTGTDPALDRITQIAMLKQSPDGRRDGFTALFNPERDIPQEVVELTGVTNEAAKQQKIFQVHAEEIHNFIKGCDLIGFNLYNYDVPILWEEFYRCGIQWNLEGIHIVDAGNIFKKKHPRDLTAAVKQYCGREPSQAHDALADASDTAEVLAGQLKAHDDLATMAIPELAKFSQMNERVDLAGKIVLDKDGDPSYSIGKSKGVKVKDDPSFARWMLSRDFTAQTKNVLSKILDDVANKGQGGLF